MTISAVALQDSQEDLPAVRQELINTALGPASSELPQRISDVRQWQNAMACARLGDAIEESRKTGSCFDQAQ